jgi:hypothetical protein
LERESGRNEGKYPRIRQLSVKKNRGASSVNIKFFKTGTTPMPIAKTCFVAR